MNVQEQPSMVTEEPRQASVGHGTGPTATREAVARARGAEWTRRLTVLIFGLVQIVIGLRIVLLVLDARTGNAIVSGILNVSQGFVGPFEGILGRNALQAGGSTLDVAAVGAFVGWTILELLVIWAIDLLRREPAPAA